MRPTLVLAAGLVSFLFSGSVLAKNAPATDGLQAFYGEVKAVSRSARTITIELGMRFVFHITDETKITVRGGAAVSLDNIKPGEGALVVARRNAGNTGIAVKITVEPGAHFPAAISARTVQGQTISGIAVYPFVTYKPPTEVVNRNINFGRQSGLFVLSVQRDGTVGNVRPLRSFGLGELDERARKWLMKWKFRPNALTEVRVPMTYNSFRRY
jgi:hypothetical protein